MSSSLHNKGHLSPSSKTTILVVDDDKIIRELCGQALRNYRVIHAGTCEEALRIYVQEPVDLVLSDILMPGESGIDLLRQIKTFNPNATVVLMTGFMDKEIILNALKEDADDFINKPLNLLQLRTSIEKALSRKKLKKELADVKRSEEIKNTFLSLVSHKLRTPITGISLFLQNLQMGVFNPEEPVFRQSLDMANEEARYLGQLVGELLEFSQVMVSGTGVNKSLRDLNEIVADVLITCREAHSDSSIAIDFTPGAPLFIQLDDAKFRFALLQVTDNAFKFSGKSGHVSIRIGSNGDAAFIIVADAGIGIPEPELLKVFERFYQIDPNRTGQIRGFGLGLFYAREFIRQHGGTISLASEPGSGTTVTISLPLQ